LSGEEQREGDGEEHGERILELEEGEELEVLKRGNADARRSAE
jgi:hypothetical protein